MTMRHIEGSGSPDLSGASWRASSFSQDRECVEAAFLPDGHVALRQSNDPGGAVILYTRGEWDAFLKGAKDGEFDLT